jgi:hypothetical protein
MVGFVAWFAVGIVALFSLVGFTGVVATSAVTVVRRVRHQPPPQRVDQREHVSAAA